MKVKEIYPNLFLYTFPNQYELASTFIRLQEFYESPYKDIKGHLFTLEQFMDRYAKDQEDNKFTYFEDWNGFNVPGNMLNRFYHIFGSDMSDKEYKLFDVLGHMGNERYYIIGIVEGEVDIIEHEIAHALYYLNEDYKHEMRRIINNMTKSMKRIAEKYLKKLGYCKTVYKDELQAYFATGINKGMICIWHHIIFQSYILKIKQVFKKYYEEIQNA